MIFSAKGQPAPPASRLGGHRLNFHVNLSRMHPLVALGTHGMLIRVATAKPSSADHRSIVGLGRLVR